MQLYSSWGRGHTATTRQGAQGDGSFYGGDQLLPGDCQLLSHARSTVQRAASPARGREPGRWAGVRGGRNRFLALKFCVVREAASPRKPACQGQACCVYQPSPQRLPTLGSHSQLPLPPSLLTAPGRAWGRAWVGSPSPREGKLPRAGGISSMGGCSQVYPEPLKSWHVPVPPPGQRVGVGRAARDVGEPGASAWRVSPWSRQGRAGAVVCPAGARTEPP